MKVTALRFSRVWPRICRVCGHLRRSIAEELFPSKYGWFGDYDRWEDVVAISSGYNAKAILEKVVSATRQVVSGEAAFERDSVVFAREDWNWPLLVALFRVSAATGGTLRVLDFGGSLGSVYFQNRSMFGSIKLMWHVVEQPHFVSCGREEFQNEFLSFWSTVDECLERNAIDVLLLSSVLPYLERPHETLDELLSRRFPFVIIDRTGIVNRGRDRLTLQRVDPAIYRASYPCWFLDQSRLSRHFEDTYKTVLSFNALDKVNIHAKAKGFLYHLVDEDNC